MEQRHDWLGQYSPSVSPTLSYPDCALADFLSDAAQQYPARPAISFYGRVLTYRQLNAQVEALALGLRGLGVKKGSVVGLMLPNLPQTVIGFYAAWRIGAVVTPVNPLFVEEEIASQLSDAGCDTLIVLDRLVSRVQGLLSTDRLKSIIATAGDAYVPWWKRLLVRLRSRNQSIRDNDLKKTEGVIGFKDLMEQKPRISTEKVQASDLALIQYTGGTTGMAKGVLLTHRNLVSNAWQCRHWMPQLQHGAEVFLGVLPFFHVYGLSVCQNLAIVLGASQVLLPRFQVADVLQAITRERVSVFPGIQGMYVAINHYQHVNRYNLESLRVCISGAGPLHRSVQEQFEALTGARLVEGYGLTEAGPVTHVNPLGDSDKDRRVGSIGLPLPDTEARIVDPLSGDGDLSYGEVGELVVRGPQVMKGYLNRDDETQLVLRKGWLFTGDLARRDADGYFFIEDRKKDLIKSGGENVYPREVEDVLFRHPKIKEAAVVGIPQDLRGELIKAYVVLKDGMEATSGELLEHCRLSLAKFKVPKKIEIRSDLPKSHVGKVLRRVLIEEELKKKGGSSSERHAMGQVSQP